MEFMTGEKKRTDISVAELLSGRLDGEQVTMRGMVHIIRDMGEVLSLIHILQLGLHLVQLAMGFIRHLRSQIRKPKIKARQL